MSNIDDYMMSASALEKGVLIPVAGRPGSETQYIEALYAHSNAGKARIVELRRTRDGDLSTREIVLSLVSGWSFADPLTMDNVKMFLDRRPDVYGRVENAITDALLFFDNERTDSLNGSAPKSNSVPEVNPGDRL